MFFMSLAGNDAHSVGRSYTLCEHLFQVTLLYYASATCGLQCAINTLFLFSSFPGYYFTGDGARRDEDGYYWVTGRVDDLMNVSEL